MQTVIIGAGIAGTLCAYALQQRGIAARVLERHNDAAQESSFANGAQLSYGICDPLADPALLPKLPAILLGRDPAFRIGRNPDPRLLRWGLSFLRESRTSRRDQRAAELLKLSARSRALMPAVAAAVAPGSGLGEPVGKLVLLPHEPSAETHRRAALKGQYGHAVELLDRSAALALEPALEAWRDNFAGALLAPEDTALDARSFCQQTAQWLMQQGVRFDFGCSVEQLRPVSAGSWQIVTDGGVIEADAVVVCGNLGSAELLEPLGIRVPVLAMRGYSLTLRAAAMSPKTSITALKHRLVFTRLGDRVRIAGFADINPRTAPEQRFAELRATARAIAPAAADYDDELEPPWWGDRGMTPTSVPLLGATERPGLFLNVGHGMYGWTLGAACAERTADAVARYA
ncbi:MAG: FAD-dependent oxidoreductase [Pseudomonadota bacterium]